MQFSLRALLIVVTFAAIYCGVLFGLPVSNSVFVLAGLSGILPGIIVGGIVYSRSQWRAFWVGCAAGGVAVGFFLGLQVFLPSYAGGNDTKYLLYGMAIWHSLILLNGMVVAAISWRLARTL